MTSAAAPIVFLLSMRLESTARDFQDQKVILKVIAYFWLSSMARWPFISPPSFSIRGVSQ